MTEQSKLVRAQSKRSNAIRSGIPAGVRAALKLQAGDTLDWDIVIKGDRIIAEVSKAEAN